MTNEIGKYSATPNTKRDFSHLTFVMRTPTGTEHIRGYPNIFGDIYELHSKPLEIHTLRLVRNLQTAEDIVQQTFERTQRWAENAPPETNIGVPVFFYKVATNLVVDHIRRASLINFDNIDSYYANTEYEDQHPAPPAVIAVDSPELETMQQETKDEVAEIMDLIKPRYKFALLSEQAGMSCAEIGAILGISREGAKSLLFRGRAKFKKQWLAKKPHPDQ